ncbi:biopolymer transport protein ExbB [Hoeflea halophila]|uniref:Biopolymer transport protein ExbB n=1 Tax=Hoeflea halophila TaxID=714899 RepID=A0A286IFI9_9HYPH|nr:MotA/TolQ/ExbB proton channel family protein [Hoeflea halophila]SOE18870.1 biopolymer transport protein ExbB [Hoeflea halophila]
MTLFENPIAQIQQFVDIGGPVVVLLLILSVIALSVALFKLWQFKSLRLGTEKGLHTIISLAVRLKRQHAGRSPSRGDLEDVLAVAANAQIKQLQRGFRVLDTIAQIAPLIGLFGTVLGMITAFQALQQSGNSVDPSILAGGIWVALLTTAVGLAVAMPTSIALTYFESRVERHQTAIEAAVTRILNPVAQAAFEEVQGHAPKAGAWPVPADAA